MDVSDRRALGLAGLLTFTGSAHFWRARMFDALVPARLPFSARTWVYGSGAAEVAVAATLAHPRTRRLGGLFAAVLFAAVFPGNVKMAVDAFTHHASARAKVATLARLPVQAPLVRWGLRVSRGE